MHRRTVEQKRHGGESDDAPRRIALYNIYLYGYLSIPITEGMCGFFHRSAGYVLARYIINIIYASQRVAAWHEISPVRARVLKNRNKKTIACARRRDERRGGGGRARGKKNDFAIKTDLFDNRGRLIRSPGVVRS